VGSESTSRTSLWLVDTPVPDVLATHHISLFLHSQTIIYGPRKIQDVSKTDIQLWKIISEDMYGVFWHNMKGQN
jgi:hypothetical protein